MLNQDFMLLLEQNPPVEYHWSLLNDSWKCVSHSIDVPFTDWLFDLGFVIPGCISSCVADNDNWHLVFSEFGDQIYVKLYKKLYYDKNASSRN